MTRRQQHVVMVATQFPPVYGGAGTQALELCRALQRREWRATVVTLDQANVGSTVEDRLRVVRVGRRIRPDTRVRRVATTILLGMVSAFTVLRQRPAAVHVHGAYWWSIPPILAGRLIRATVVVKLTRDGDDDPATVMGKRMWGIPIGGIYGLSLRHADHVVALNRSMVSAAHAAGIGGRVRAMTNGVDLDRYVRTPERRRDARRHHGVQDDRFVITFVGFLVRHKGILDLLEAWERNVAESTAELWLVGPAEGFYRELTRDALDWMESRPDVAYSIRRFGHVPNEELPEIYWASDAFVLPSHQEGMPNALLEAIVAGCQVVATRISGIVDVVDDTTAFLVKPGDIDALANSLMQVSNHEVKKTADLMARLSIDDLAGRYVELYSPKMGL